MRVHSAEGVVEEVDVRPAVQRPCQRKVLPLAAGKIDACIDRAWHRQRQYRLLRARDSKQRKSRQPKS